MVHPARGQRLLRVAHGGRALEVYTRPYDPLRPQVCMDETSKQLLRETRQSLPVGPGRPEREDYEYERGGVANVFSCSWSLWRAGAGST